MTSSPTHAVLVSALNIATDLLSPAYLFLSVMAVCSRYNSILKKLASHGKTTAVTTVTTTTTGVVTLQKKSTNNSRNSWLWISKKCFVHFYLIGLLSIGMVMSLASNNTTDNTPTITTTTAARALLILHLCRRVCECLFVQRFRSSSKMHVAGYALGMGHYLVLPLVFWNVSFLDGGEVDPDVEDRKATMTGRSLPVIVLLLAASNLYLQYEQYQHHVILASLRRQSPAYHDENNSNSRKQKGIDNDKRGETTTITHHSVPPPRRWFQWVWCPHYLAEILLYLTFVLLLEYDNSNYINSDTSNIRHRDHLCFNVLPLPIQLCRDAFVTLFLPLRRYHHWFLLLWVTTNLTVSALNNHDWYQEQFRCHNYKSSPTYRRKALVPFLL
ncbi:3-oxo-5-alpha-steroid 4-dehydrogenase-domain containing protein [Nitzschia inconspicua]|uniref:3-oxo-5-alpha-steroid 4-dehydrogenase-domain containing protein n=1 Tax=Nitzschia inconspicua TaxID=303405 RepID=A0A9K3PBS5_9STRA|nr:3-oxo-5-alpha-steroid 4-dehydrogenase-domain containing protein [Nitzschia inconspicua]